MHTFKSVFVAGTLAFSVLSVSGQTVSYNIGVISVYSDDARDVKNVRPAVTFGADYEFGNGFYVGNGNTTGTFVKNDAAELTRTVDMALYAGYANELANGVHYDVSATRYVFPGAGLNNGNEGSVAVGYGFLTVSYTKPFTSSKFDGAHAVDLTFSHSLSQAIAADLTVSKDQGVSSLGIELAFAYDLGNNLIASVALNRLKPKLVIGLSQSF